MGFWGSDLLFGFVVVLSLAIGTLAGGKLSRLGELRLVRFEWVFGSLLMKFGLARLLAARTRPSPFSCTFLSLVTYAMLFYGLYPNLSLPGFPLLGLGTLLNFTAIMANKGRMPVQVAGGKAVLSESQFQALTASFTHQHMSKGTKLKFLADIYTWKFPSGRPTAFSLGDVLMAVGVFWFVLLTLRRGFPLGGKDATIS